MPLLFSLYVSPLRFLFTLLFLQSVLVVSAQAILSENSPLLTPCGISDESEYSSYLYRLRTAAKNPAKARELEILANGLSSLNKSFTAKICSVNFRNLAGAYFESISNYHLAKSHLRKALSMAQNNSYPEGTIYACNYLGYVYWHESKYDSAFHYHKLAAEAATKFKIETGISAFTKLMLGNDHFDTGDYVKSSEHYYSALKDYEKLNDTCGLILTHNRLGKLYYKLKDLSMALKQVMAARELLSAYPYDRELAFSYNSLGNIHIEHKRNDSALFYFRKTYDLYKSCGDIIGRSIASINLGDTYQALYNRGTAAYLDSSNRYYKLSLELNDIADNKFGMVYGYWGIADNLMKKNLDAEAREYYRKALNLSIAINALSEEYNLYGKIYRTFENDNKDSAYHYLKKYSEAKDNAENEEKTKEFLRQENKYLLEKRLSEEKIMNEQEKLLLAEKHKWKNYVLICILVIALALAYLVYASVKRVKTIAQKNEVINSINRSLSIQNKEITDSINYAKRIQAAVLPPERIIKENLPQSFVLYKPKNIIAGDFYWLEKVGVEVLFAAADCTGHGVPGAMVSVICNNGLNRSVREYKITEPGKILDKAREIVIQEFEKSDEEVKDGMDISLCALKGTSLRWAGANNPLWIIRNKELIEIRPDKQPIGKYTDNKPFTTHTLQLQPGDCIYIFTDGYADQFGGEKGKKFKYSNLKSLLISIQHQNMNDQKKILDGTFENWKGDLEQIDDVCIIGVRI